MPQQHERLGKGLPESLETMTRSKIEWWQRQERLRVEGNWVKNSRRCAYTVQIGTRNKWSWNMTQATILSLATFSPLSSRFLVTPQPWFVSEYTSSSDSREHWRAWAPENHDKA